MDIGSAHQQTIAVKREIASSTISRISTDDNYCCVFGLITKKNGSSQTHME